MKYMGSKARIAKYIIPIITKDLKEDQTYIEPFVGGCNIIDKIEHKHKIGADYNKYLIAMFKGLQLNLPRDTIIPKDLYSKARTSYNTNNRKVDDFTIGWIGWMASYNGRFFDGGYSGHSAGPKKRDYIDEQIRNTEKQINLLQDVKFIHSSYENLEYPDNSRIYCDIPYKRTKQYSTSKDFDYDKFWEWCRTMEQLGHQVFISEYQAPEDFTCVWEKEITNSMNQTNTKRPTEKLFRYTNV